MDIRFIVTVLIVAACGFFQAEVSRLFNNYLIDYYEQSFLSALTISSYAVSLMVPFGLWFVIGLLIHMMTIIVGKPGSLRELYFVSGICFIPFLLNLIFAFVLLQSTNVDIGSELSKLATDASYDVRITNEVSLSTLRNIGTFCSFITMLIYCSVVFKVYKASVIQSILCVSTPVAIFLLMKMLFNAAPAGV